MIFVPSVLGNAAICGFVRYLKERRAGKKKNKAYIYSNTKAHKTDKTRKLKNITDRHSRDRSAAHDEQ